MESRIQNVHDESTEVALRSGELDRLEDDLKESGASAAEVSLLDILIVLGRRKWLILSTTSAAALLSLIITMLIPKQYTANVTVLPPQQNSSLSSTLLAQMSNLGALGSLAGGSLGLKNPADMTVALFKSRTVEDAMIQRFNLTERYRKKRLSDARKAFEDRCSIDNNAKDGLIRIAIEDHDPHRAAEIANGYIQEYQKLSSSLALTEASQRRLFFEQQLEQAKNNLASAEEAMKTSQQNGGLIQLDSQAKALIESVASLKGQIVAKEVQIRSLSLSETANNPDLMMARQQLAALQNQLRELGGSKDTSDSDLIVPRGKIPQAGMEYARKLRDVKYYEMIFELLAKQFEVAKLDEAREGAVIQVVDSAIPPDRPSFPRLSIIVPAATLTWMICVLAWVLLTEGIKGNRRPEDQEKLRMLKDAWRARIT